MRVVGGAWRGRALAAPSGQGTRPTSDRVREAIFDVLAALPEMRVAWGEEGVVKAPLAGHRCLDLFAGSGALGIEALSRGAAACTFVERSPHARRALETNLKRLGLLASPLANGPAAESSLASASTVRLAACDYRQSLAADARRGALYTLLFVDPPYDAYAEIEPVLATHLSPVLAPGAVLVVETAARTRLKLPWRAAREKRYGDTRVTFLVADNEVDPRGVHDDDAEAT